MQKQKSTNRKILNQAIQENIEFVFTIYDLYEIHNQQILLLILNIFDKHQLWRFWPYLVAYLRIQFHQFYLFFVIRKFQIHPFQIVSILSLIRLIVASLPEMKPTSSQRQSSKHRQQSSFTPLKLNTPAYPLSTSPQPLQCSLDRSHKTPERCLPELNIQVSSGKGQFKRSLMDDNQVESNRISKNPFARFFNDSNSKKTPENQSNKGRDNLSPIPRSRSSMKNDLFQDQDSPSVIRSDAPQKKRTLAHRNQSRNQNSRPEQINFFKDENPNVIYSKLLWFTPNVKNGRFLEYNLESHRCQPVFKCEGCYKEFEVASALGGHLSRCQYKYEHHQATFQHQQLAKDDKRFDRPNMEVQEEQMIRKSTRLLTLIENGKCKVLTKEDYEKEEIVMREGGQVQRLVEQKEKKVKKMPKGLKMFNMRRAANKKMTLRSSSQSSHKK